MYIPYLRIKAKAMESFIDYVSELFYSVRAPVTLIGHSGKGVRTILCARASDVGAAAIGWFLDSEEASP